MNKNVFPNAKLKTYPHSFAYQQSFPHFPHSELNLMFKHTIQQSVEKNECSVFMSSTGYHTVIADISR